MDVIVVDQPEEAGELVGEIIASLIARKPDAVIGLATGSSVLPVYRNLVDRCTAGLLSLARARAFLLDEYIGLAPLHPHSCAMSVERQLRQRIDLPRVAAPRVHGGGLDAACADYEAMIRDAGGIDVQLLGIGRNGHIGFNEPPASFDSCTRVVRLSNQTREDNARFFGSIDEVPAEAVTQGVETILAAKRVVLMAFGAAKASAVARAVERAPAPTTPASALQLHPNAAAFLDRAAASELRSSVSGSGR